MEAGRLGIGDVLRQYGRLEDATGANAYRRIEVPIWNKHGRKEM